MCINNKATNPLSIPLVNKVNDPLGISNNKTVQKVTDPLGLSRSKTVDKVTDPLGITNPNTTAGRIADPLKLNSLA